MIISRYLTRDILSTTLAVSLVLLFIFLGSRFAKYLADVAAGYISREVLFALLLFRIPILLQRILPMALFLSILLVFGRMYMDNEISVLHASGVSLSRLFLSSLWAVAVVALLVAVFALYVGPRGEAKMEKTLNQERSRSELDLIEAGQFLQLRGGGGAVYAGGLSADRSEMTDVFIAKQLAQGDWVVVRSVSGRQHNDAVSDKRFLTLEKGLRYTFIPGTFTADRLRFDSLTQRLATQDEYSPRKFDYDTVPTLRLFGDKRLPYQAALQWRLSLIFLVPIVSLLAVAMSQTTPRRGRYLKLLPAMLLYFAYMTSLDVLRESLAKGDLALMPGLLLVHVPFAIIGLVLLYWNYLSLWWRAQ